MKKIIAIDFDGVLFTEAYPAVGMPIAPNINRAKNERANGAVLICGPAARARSWRTLWRPARPWGWNLTM